MCHVLLLMPIFGLPVFWLMPLSFAIPIYLMIVAMSGLLYWLIMKSMNKRVEIGLEGLIGTEAEVVSQLDLGNRVKYLVRSRGELWTARSTETLHLGERVTIAALKGISLVVERRDNSSHPDQLSSLETK